MKRIIYYIIAFFIITGSVLSFSLLKSSDPVDIVVHGSSDSGYSWVRTYTGPEDQVDLFVQKIRDSYLRLAESMHAGSSLKILFRDELIAYSKYDGDPNAPFSGVQIVVHDRFASQLDFYTSDSPPGLLSDMESPQEPFICGSREISNEM